MKIIGAGLSGLIAGSLFHNATILEASERGKNEHRAVLRFRTPNIGDALGIDFRPVTVRKGVWFDGRFVAPDIRMANWYARKCTGRVMDRSIWNLESVTRWIAPENLIERLIDRLASRIRWSCEFDFGLANLDDGPIINTAPMNIVRDQLHLTRRSPQFQYEPIVVERYRVEDCDVHQTIYFPDPCTPLYRASITGDLMICEYTNAPDPHWVPAEAFGISRRGVEPLDAARQSYGKIAPIEEGWRRSFIRALTEQHNIYSLGRFATWRNILLDDVLKDITVIKKLIASDSYARAQIGAGRIE